MLLNLINYVLQNYHKFNNKNQLEFEIRFGKYNRISSNIKPAAFIKLVNSYTGVKHFQLIDETIYDNGKSSIKKRIHYKDYQNLLKKSFDYDKIDENIDEARIHELLEQLKNKEKNPKTLYISKELIGKKVSMDGYNASISTEITHDTFTETANILTKKIKLRCSWTDEMWIHDLTIVLIGTDTKGIFYEVEMEFDIDYLTKKRDMDLILDNTVSQINKIMTIIDCSKISGVEIEMRYGIFNAVATLERSDINKLQKAEYAVCDKADGERKFVFIDDKKNVFYFNPIEGIITKHLIKNIKLDMPDTLIDCELINDEFFYGFDILFYKGVDCRNNDLIHRLSLLSQVIDALNRTEIKDKKKDKKKQKRFNIKTFYTDDVFKNAANIWNNREKLFPYNLDGLIFTPAKGSYLGNLPNLKYKPLVSIDVRIMYNRDADFTEFYAMGYPIEIKGRVVNMFIDRTTKKTYYKHKVTINDFKLKEMGVVNNNGVLGIKGRVENQPDMLNIIEMEFVPHDGWKFLRTRPDKEVPNAHKSIISALNAIKDNITIEEISKLKHIKSPLELIRDKKCYDKIGYNFISPNITSEICEFYTYAYLNILDIKGKSILVLGADLCIFNALLKSAYTDICIIEDNCMEVYGETVSEGYMGLKEYYRNNHSSKNIEIIWGDTNISGGLKSHTKDGKKFLEKCKKFDVVFINNFSSALYNGNKFDSSMFNKYVKTLSHLTTNVIGIFVNGDKVKSINEKQDCIIMRNDKLHPLYKIFLNGQITPYKHDDIFKEAPILLEINRLQNSFLSEHQPLLFEKNIRHVLKSANIKINDLYAIKSFFPEYRKNNKKLNEYDAIIAEITYYFTAKI